MRKFEYLFIFLFIGLTIVLLLLPRKFIYKDTPSSQPKRRLSYIQLVFLISSVVSFAVIMLVKFLINP